MEFNLIHIPESEHTVENSIRKAKAVLKHSPDIIFFEYPRDSFPQNQLNDLASEKDKEDLIDEWQKDMIKDSKIYPWLKGDAKIIENIGKLLKAGRRVLVFQIDAPREVTILCDAIVESQNRFWFDVWNFIREVYMASDIKKVLGKAKGAKALIFCHDSHWEQIEFLLKTENKEAILEHYFKTCSAGEIEEKLEGPTDILRILKKYFKKVIAK